MAISMYQASAPVFIKVLGNLRTILEKAAAHAAAKKIDESVFINARLYPDMLPLSALTTTEMRSGPTSSPASTASPRR